MPAKEGDHDAAGYGPWNPGIQSELPSRLVPLSTIFRPENSFTSAAQAAELRDLTELPLEDLATFRPERLAAHELLIRVTANISVQDPEAARIDDLGINFRRIAQTIFIGYIQPRLPEICSLYGSLKQTLSAATDAELSAVLPSRAPCPAPQRTGRGLLGFLGRPGRREKTPATSGEPWESEERRLQEWRAALDASGDPARKAAGRALARVISAVRAKHGGWWGDRALLAQLAVGLACNEYGSWALGQLIEPYMNEAREREGYRLLSPQERPVIMNVKGASASGKSTMRPLQRRLAAELGVRWSDFALVSPDIWRKYLLDYSELGGDHKYAGALTGRELTIIDQKLDRYMARKATSGGIPHLLIDRFRFDSFAPDSDEAGSNLLTRFGHSIYMFFMITPPHETVERAWKRGLEVGRYKAVDDLLAHNVEAYSGMPTLFFTWALHSAKSVHYEFLDNDVPPGERPRTVAFGWYGEMNILDVKGMLAVDRYRKIDVAATSPEQVYRRKEIMIASANTEFLTRCVRTISAVNFADPDSGRIYARFEAGQLAWVDSVILERALEDEETRAGLLALAPDAGRGSPRAGSTRVVRTDRSHTLGQWGKALVL
jgi:hypothetical protein